MDCKFGSRRFWCPLSRPAPLSPTEEMLNSHLFNDDRYLTEINKSGVFLRLMVSLRSQFFRSHTARAAGAPFEVDCLRISSQRLIRRVIITFIIVNESSHVFTCNVRNLKMVKRWKCARPTTPHTDLMFSS